ncbi:MAG: SIS domain-containing protein [Chloroflexota bacterium]
MNPYIADIQGQAAALQQALAQFDFSGLAGLARQLRAGDFDRILITGMGASYCAGYPASLQLAKSGLPVVWSDAAELLHYTPAQLTRRSLLWIISQSGRSVEVTALLDLARRQGVEAVLGTTNDLSSPLGQGAAVAMAIYAEPELTVSTRTYLNTLASTQLAAVALLGEDLAPCRAELESAAGEMAAYLADWDAQLALAAARVGTPPALALLGRGASLSAAVGGALVLAEAAKYPALGMHTAEFRHGPLEMAGPGLTVLVYAGAAQTAALNRRMLDDLLAGGSPALWVAVEPPAGLDEAHWLPLPRAHGAGLPLVEALPAQLLSVHLAQARGVTPGKFKFIGKVTLAE